MSQPLRSQTLASLTLLLAACSSGDGQVVTISVASSPTPQAPIGEVYTYAMDVVGQAQGALTYQLQVAPDGATVTDDGVIEWTPMLSDLGREDFRLRAFDGVQAVAQDWTVRVHQGLEMGTTLSPRGHTLSTAPGDFVDHYAGHASHGKIIAFHLNWRDSVATAGALTTDMQSAGAAASTYGFTAAVGFGWTDGAGAPDLISGSSSDNSWSNIETRQEYLDVVTEYALTYEPEYLFLGNEINSYYLTHTQAEWDAWVSEYEACYDAIKLVSPDTIVFTVFQLERMKGLGQHTGLADPVHFDLIDSIVAGGKVDALGFTTYPHFEYDMPSQIPAGYWAEILDHWTGAVVFTEVSWPALPNFPYPGSELDQATFVTRFLDGIAPLRVAYATWLFLHDFHNQANTPAFFGVGLRDNGGTFLRMADALWQAAVELRER